MATAGARAALAHSIDSEEENMDWFYKHVGTLQPAVVVIFVGILLVGALAYGWMARRLGMARGHLEALADALEPPPEEGAPGDERLQACLDAQPWLRQAWEATGRRVLQVGQGEARRGMLLGTVDDLWRPERLMHKVFNFSLFEAAPNIAVGVGLFFTFLFLTFALTDATVALTGNGAANPVVATKDLLSSAGGKFLSSLAGLFVSLCWTVAGKRALARLERASVRVVHAIEQRWPPVAAEAVVVEQLAHLSAAGSKLAAHHETAQDHLGLADELLTEAREQTGVLKRFETDLAVSIGKAVTAGFSPQMEQMTARLEKAISDLSERMSTMNEDALRTMMQDFSQAISANTAEEMQQFKTTLTELSAKLGEAGGALKDNVGAAASTLSEATGQMTQGLAAATQQMTGDIAAAAQGLVSSVQGMDAVMDKTAGTVREIDTTLSRAAALGAQGVEKMDASLAGAGRLLDRMGDVGDGWAQVNDDLKGLVAKLVEACDGIDELTQEQHGVARALHSAGPEVLGAVGEMRQQLEAMVRSVSQDMTRVQAALGHSSSDLAGVVNAIKDGVVQYSQQLAKLHQAMDAEMAKAVNRLGGAVQTLDESIGELNDSLDDLGLRK